MNRLETLLKESVRKALTDMYRELRKDQVDNTIPQRDFRYYAILVGTHSIQYFIEEAYHE